MTGDKDTEASFLCIENIYEALSSDQEMATFISNEAQWAHILQESVHQLSLEIGEGTDTQKTVEEWKRTWSHVSHIQEAGLVLTDSVSLAHIAYAAKEYKTSKNLLDNSTVNPSTYMEWMVQVFAEATTYPEKIRWLSQLKLPKRVIDIYEANQKNHQQINR